MTADLAVFDLWNHAQTVGVSDLNELSALPDLRSGGAFSKDAWLDEFAKKASSFGTTSDESPV